MSRTAKGVRAVAALVLGVVALAGQRQVPAWAEIGRASVEPVELTNAFSSPDALIDALLRALERDDPGALRRLRITEAEYREIILPGSLREGQPLRRYPKEAADFAWSHLDTRSAYHELALMHGYRGRRFRVKAVEYDKGIGTYANHTAHKQLRLTLEEAGDGKEVRLATGSIVEIDGRYKFISFIAD